LANNDLLLLITHYQY